ncbi:hypothetical protein PHLGIDRAFT_18724, partial [Phlebiopsis gigantea 11061_1 CR5-6]
MHDAKLKPQGPIREPAQQRTKVDVLSSTLPMERKWPSEPLSTPKTEPPPIQAQDKGKEPLTSFTFAGSGAPPAGSTTP